MAGRELNPVQQRELGRVLQVFDNYTKCLVDWCRDAQWLTEAECPLPPEGYTITAGEAIRPPRQLPFSLNSVTPEAEASESRKRRLNFEVEVSVKEDRGQEIDIPGDEEEERTTSEEEERTTLKTSSAKKELFGIRTKATSNRRRTTTVRVVAYQSEVFVVVLGTLEF